MTSYIEKGAYRTLDTISFKLYLPCDETDSPPVMFVSPEDSGYSQHSGAEEAPDGPGHFDEDSGLLLHCDLLWRPLQRGEADVQILNHKSFVTTAVTCHHLVSSFWGICFFRGMSGSVWS